jgi:CheY-like chemotaxis protein
LRALDGASFDLVLSDIDMMDGTGFDIARSVKRPQKFVFMSGLVDRRRQNEAEKLEATIYEKGPRLLDWLTMISAPSQKTATGAEKGSE